MTASFPQLSESQMIVLQRTLVRAGEAVPNPGPDFADWLKRSQLVIPAGIHVGKLHTQNPFKFDLQDRDFRKYVLGYMTGFDCFTEAKANAIETLLVHVEEYPNVTTDTRRLRTALRDTNKRHRDTVHLVWALVDRAYQRFNENVNLGRPIHIALNILFEELLESSVFSGGARSHEDLFYLFERADELLSKIKAGKTHPENLLRSTITQLEKLTTAAFIEVSEYWYSEVMVKQYFRDTLIPNAILNNYIDPHDTADLLGAVWRFITDLPYDPHLLVCVPLLRHQPQESGTRFATVADFTEEIFFSRVQPSDFPTLKVRIEQKHSLVEDPEANKPSILALCEHPSIRLSHEKEFLEFLLGHYLKDSELTPAKLSKWLSTSFFSIDPRHGIPAQCLSTALRLALSYLKKGEKIESIPCEELHDIYQRVLHNKCNDLIKALHYPFSSEYLKETRELDPFELREALVDLVLEGVYQPASDWQEERELSGLVTLAVKAVDAAEKEVKLSEVANIKSHFENIEKTLEQLEIRAKLIVFDTPSLRLWNTTCVDLLLSLNQSKRRGIFALPYNPELMVSVNLKSMQELIVDEIRSDIISALQEIAQQ
jgi:hypothetical protein